MGRSSAVRRIVVLEPAGASKLRKLIEEGGELNVEAVTSVEAAIALCEEQVVDALVADPELVEGWVVDISVALTEKLSQKLPVLFVCRSPVDARLIENRLINQELGAVVLTYDQLSSHQLHDLISGELARGRKTI